MLEQDKQKPVQKVLESIGNKETDFEAEQNLIGAFSILLEWDKRINPQNYGLKINENHYD